MDALFECEFLQGWRKKKKKIILKGNSEYNVTDCDFIKLGLDILLRISE